MLDLRLQRWTNIEQTQDERWVGCFVVHVCPGVVLLYLQTFLGYRAFCCLAAYSLICIKTWNTLAYDATI